ncbi:YbhB/YbcL family Raf kinase inhibitor-like protein [Bombilactobacillus folatiphilus]|uniref:YbhB/YbcL family Raf kinase inhibitor-like protein n=1 Tax=Bombilactobacillus folatiphilus TaxID=2923362 RepID=A0ABY4P9K9_9LACO|nr:YbhB/YbcL family Raf kinase inhibitor-like protein [Bombilactobacillus folatiphilus]UQS82300.1 YbhB/YbcL family Raf kinase inhibitor-like protein [Bombilactobacillus folatiphilus]
MKINVPLIGELLPKKYGKFATGNDLYQNKYPATSFPIEIADVPALTKSLALTFLDPDSIPVCGFEWIHWTVANIAPDIHQIPENASQKPPFTMLQGKNSFAGSMLNQSDPLLNQTYHGPTPPSGTHQYELRVYALDQMLDLQPGFWLNELIHEMAGRILTHQKIVLPYRG